MHSATCHRMHCNAEANPMTTLKVKITLCFAKCVLPCRLWQCKAFTMLWAAAQQYCAFGHRCAQLLAEDMPIGLVV
jgi:hypothetical protein